MTSIHPSSGPLGSNWPIVNDITASVSINRISAYQYQEAGFGGSADIFCGTYQPKGSGAIKVAVKCIRVKDFDGRDREYELRLQTKLAREIEIWRTLSGCTNIIALLGIINGIGPLPSPVCELCNWNLQDYLARKTPPPKHIKMLTDALKGLSYMHDLKPDPIAHGDVKSHNILVTADERAMICDFGRSRMPYDRPRDESRSSPFGATLRYMSPELFVSDAVIPTPASDMWAYGCVALEVLCRVQPYHEISNDFEVVEIIKKGHVPSRRPRGARGSLVTDALWDALAGCWREEHRRPTSREFLERLTQMLQEGEISTSPPMMDPFPLSGAGPLVRWPEDMLELSGSLVIEKSRGTLSSTQRSNIWSATLTSPLPWKRGARAVVKVPRLNISAEVHEPHDHLQNILRKTVTRRFDIKHKNIISILGIDTSFSPHPGLVFELCEFGNLASYRSGHIIDHDATCRPVPPEVNAYSLILDMLEALEYLHNFPIPVPQGDLVPENVMIAAGGTAKIGLFSFGRIISTIPAAATLTTSVGPLLPFRWMSPELLLSSRPTTESDMWAMGCMGFWVLTGLRPYAGHLRDDFAGVESVRGLPPGLLASIDYANTLGERTIVPRHSSWITNGIWNTISRCWTLDPLLRPSATNFSRLMHELGSGKRENWMPVGVLDFSGRVSGPVDERLDQVGFGRIGVTRSRTAWVQYHSGKMQFKDRIVDLNMFRTTYSPNWYSKDVKVVVKHESDRNMMVRMHSIEAYLTSVRHEIVISAQLDHPNICKFIGIDSSHAHIPAMLFEFYSNVTLQEYGSKEANFEEKVQLAYDIACALQYMHGHTNGEIAHGNLEPNTIFIENGRAKLTNFTCAFQYIAHHKQGITPLSSIVSCNYGYSRYRCPEFIKARSEDFTPLPTTVSDVWSFGCILLKLFSKDLNFFNPQIGDREMEIYILAGEAPRINGEEQLKVELRVLGIIEKALSYSPSSRPAIKDVSQMVEVLL